MLDTTRLASTIDIRWQAIFITLTLDVTNARIEGVNHIINVDHTRRLRLPQHGRLPAAHTQSHRNHRERGAAVKAQQPWKWLPRASLLFGCVVVSGGCAGGRGAPVAPSAVITWTAAKPADIPEPTADAVTPADGPVRVTAAWGSPGQLRIVTWASFGCPELPDSVTATAHTIIVTTKAFNPNGDGCTADASPATSVVTVPAIVDQTAPITVTINATTLTLPGR